MAAFKEADFIYKDGKMVKWAEATTHVLTHSLHYGNAVFEGVRACKIGDGFGIWRLDAHTQRLFESAKCCGIEIPFTREEINAAQQEILRVNTFADDVYIRPIVFLGYGKMGVSLVGCPVSVCVAAWEWGAYMGEEGLKNGIKVGISSWMKPAPFSMMARVKASANYFNSQMANYEAGLNGYDEALLLDPQGFIAEGPGECFFAVKDGVIYTPNNDTSLGSITQSSVIEMAKFLGYEVVRTRLTRDFAYTADECFFTGTAAEVTPISQIDGRVIGSGKIGKVTAHLQEYYLKAVRGEIAEFKHYITFVKRG